MATNVMALDVLATSGLATTGLAPDVLATSVLAQAERGGPLGPEFGKASPVGLFIIVLLFVAVLFIGWAVTRRIKRLNRRQQFAEANGLDVFDVEAVDAAMAEQGLSDTGKKHFF